MTDLRPLSVLRTGGLIDIRESADGARVLCVDLSRSTSDTLVITHAALDDHRGGLVDLALEALCDQRVLSREIRTLRFAGIGPTSAGAEDRNETVRRHDLICAHVRSFAARHGVLVRDAYLAPKAFSFDTLVLLEQS
ncbi:hypothetical protein [Tropicimonas sediminicola]|uniref:Uncharacterized protein n=1 Tax=Tropicimonas sediminicola TaxID=1031541 RepID=A0A239KHD7_9RHOB|nr:hypothetical protein [Tropicimonas sediminicola]SNT17033.1 hypothetical protein SAMN05421757_10787 [Tropicimonas sediminicola]